MDVTIVKPLARQFVDYRIQAAQGSPSMRDGSLAALKITALPRITIYVFSSSTWATHRRQNPVGMVKIISSNSSYVRIIWKEGCMRAGRDRSGMAHGGVVVGNELHVHFFFSRLRDAHDEPGG